MAQQIINFKVFEIVNIFKDSINKVANLINIVFLDNIIKARVEVIQKVNNLDRRALGGKRREAHDV